MRLPVAASRGDLSMKKAKSPPPIERIILTLPAFNEAQGIGELLSQAAATLQAEGVEWNIIVVDDGSADATAEIVQRAGQKYPSISLVRHEVNRGLGPAIMTGFSKALELSDSATTLVVGMDADLTHPPEVIPVMRRAADSGADLIIASRFQTGSIQVGVSAFRRFLSWGARTLFHHLLALPGVEDYTCGFRAIRASLIARGIERFSADGLITRRGFACTDEILIKLALLDPVIREVPFTLRYDLKRGRSKINLGVTLLETLRLLFWALRELARARSGAREDPSRASGP